MADRRLNDIEDLVQSSVFNPSPCRRLRERILHDAARAHRRQQNWQRAVPFVLATMGILGATLLGVRVLKAPHPPAVDTQAAGTAQVQPEQPGSRSTPETAVQPGLANRSEQSLGEALYLGKIRRPENTVDPSTQKELAPSQE